MYSKKWGRKKRNNFLNYNNATEAGGLWWLVVEVEKRIQKRQRRTTTNYGRLPDEGKEESKKEANNHGIFKIVIGQKSHP